MQDLRDHQWMLHIFSVASVSPSFARRLMCLYLCLLSGWYHGLDHMTRCLSWLCWCKHPSNHPRAFSFDQKETLFWSDTASIISNKRFHIWILWFRAQLCVPPLLTCGLHVSCSNNWMKQGQNLFTDSDFVKCLFALVGTFWFVESSVEWLQCLLSVVSKTDSVPSLWCY